MNPPALVKNCLIPDKVECVRSPATFISVIKTVYSYHVKPGNQMRVNVSTRVFNIHHDSIKTRALSGVLIDIEPTISWAAAHQ